jgi:hypothetical protein
MHTDGGASVAGHHKGVGTHAAAFGGHRHISLLQRFVDASISINSAKAIAFCLAHPTLLVIAKTLNRELRTTARPPGKS